ncbi:MAG: class I SAM-dependent methyltransferase, partial [Halanaerobiales bacterium]
MDIAEGLKPVKEKEKGEVILVMKMNKMNLKKLIEMSNKPEVFERTEEAFWDDPHISGKMLEFHLDPTEEAASRSQSTIEKSVKWIDEELKARYFLNDNLLKKNIKILDLGCGPGLYASRLAGLGYTLTGIDYSRNSIEYARKYSEENNIGVDYIYQNYLTIDYNDEFDVILLIYCDLGALTDAERDNLLERTYKALKPGGTFIFDVFTDKNRNKDDLKRYWELTDGGFW